MSAPATVFASPEDLIGAVGTRLGESSWWEVGQAQIDTFAELTGDRQWIHVDPDRAATGPFGTTIAHGYLVLSLISTLRDEIVRVDGTDMAINKGLERLRFRNPVPSGARVRIVADLTSATPGMRRYVDVVYALTMEIEGERAPAYTVDSLVLYRGADGDARGKPLPPDNSQG